MVAHLVMTCEVKGSKEVFACPVGKARIFQSHFECFLMWLKLGKHQVEHEQGSNAYIEMENCRMREMLDTPHTPH